MTSIRRSDYLAAPEIWGDQEYESRDVLAEEVKPGDLIVFESDLGNAYRVVSIDALDSRPNDERILYRYNCVGGATAGRYEGTTIPVVVTVAGRKVSRADDPVITLSALWALQNGLGPDQQVRLRVITAYGHAHAGVVTGLGATLTLRLDDGELLRGVRPEWVQAIEVVGR
ncbi:hypothetical protein RM780_09700 [Streptomyces sp. DSM 44917]|uniref:Uncharacterized protein n=1 Tax=Streptomyces boetiae TaxID=3075541 RepID=A0ABU2L6P0_9ACTN|nr:hypothetical protein [Streptomyces sp. DSM 44917]MDT0307236.1 hypothetical protein [Streptomyces sp. DSM 44917]